MQATTKTNKFTKLNNYQLLLVNQWHLLKRNRKFIIIFGLIIAISLLFDIVMIIYIKKPGILEEKENLLTALIAVNSLVWALSVSWFTFDLFSLQFKNNIDKLELRYGCKQKEIFLSRFFFEIIFVLSFFLVSFLISLVFGLSEGIKEVIVYRYFISSFGWYAIEIWLTLSLVILIARLLKEPINAILATLLIIFGLGVPFVVSFSTKAAESKIDYLPNNPYFYLYRENFGRDLNKEFSKNENTKSLYWEYRDSLEIKNSNLTTKVIAGLDHNLIPQAPVLEGLPSYQSFMNLVMQSLKDTDFTSFTDFKEFVHTSYEKEVKLSGLLKHLKGERELKKYQNLFDALINLDNNGVLLRENGVLATIGRDSDWPGIDVSIKNLIKPDQYAFVKYLNSFFILATEVHFQENSSQEFEPIYIPTNEVIYKLMKKNRLQNMLNPLRHIALMFQSINYNKTLLDASNCQSSYGVGNLIYKENNLANPDSPLGLHRAVYVEVIYLVYFVVGALLIYLAYIKFKKQIKP